MRKFALSFLRAKIILTFREPRWRSNQPTRSTEKLLPLFVPITIIAGAISD
jgi:hypothetical protein